VLKFGFPGKGNDEDVNRWRLENIKNLWRGWKSVILSEKLNLATFYGRLDLRKIPANWQDEGPMEYGLASFRAVTDAGVAYIVDAFSDSATYTVDEFNYHGIGTGTTAENQTQTDLVTGIRTDLTGDVWATGSQSNPSAPVYQTVGTNTIDTGAPHSIREHAIFIDDNPGTTMLDRTLFALITLQASDSLQSTYQLTLTAGG